MKELSKVKSSQNESLSRENCTDLTCSFSKENENKNRLAFLLLERAATKIGEIFDENEITGLIEEALFLACDDCPDVILEAASLYFLLGKNLSKNHFLFRSQHLYSRAYSLAVSTFSDKSAFWHGWANLHIELYNHLQEENLLIAAIKKFERAERWVDPKERSAFQFFWDFAKAWLLLATQSQEMSDLSRAMQKFKKAEELGVSDLAFWNDVGDAHFLLGRRTSNESFIRSAIDYYKKGREKEEKRAWVQICFAAKELTFCTGRIPDLEEADQFFRDALLALPSCANLWLEWGDLFLRFGWLNKDISFIDKGLEKLTSLKIGECSPLLTSSLLGMGMSMMGLFIDNFKLIREGRETLLSIHAFSKEYHPLNMALGFSDLAFGIYFDNEKAIEQAIATFETSIVERPHLYFPYFGLYEAHLVLAMMRGDDELLEKGLCYLARLSQLRPKLPQLYLDWGMAYLRFSEKGEGEKIEAAIEKLKIAISLDRSDLALFTYATALTLLGDKSGEEGCFEEALDILQELLIKNPASHPYHHQRAITLSHFGEVIQDVDLLMESAALLEIFVRKEKEDETLLVELGYTHLLLSEWHDNEEKRELFLKKAEKELLKAAHLGHEEAHYHLACLYSIIGSMERSLHFLKCSLRFGVIERSEIDEDEWLENLKKSDYFKKFLAQES